jgi:hypothetical protein
VGQPGFESSEFQKRKLGDPAIDLQGAVGPLALRKTQKRIADLAIVDICSSRREGKWKYRLSRGSDKGISADFQLLFLESSSVRNLDPVVLSTSR